MKRLLMIDPPFPRPKKSPNHKNSLPIGLLKIGSYYESMGWDVTLCQLGLSMNHIDGEFDKIIVTSLFTYWSKYVIEAVEWAKEHYPSTFIEVGGIWASLMPKECKELTGADNVFIGVMEEAEAFEPNYELLSHPIDYQILHTSRGCQRRCKPCGVYCIEPQQSFISSIKDKVHKRKLVFYDNNLLNNPYIEDILRELIILKRKRLILHCESQSGFDGRILRKKPYLAKMLNDAGFVYPKIAWDGNVKSYRKRKEEIDILINAGYKKADISIFMLTNYEQTYSELEFKRMYCFKWSVQITPCRFIPLNQLSDNFIMKRKNQTNDDYFIHPNWTDAEVKQYNRNIRRHNMVIRFRSPYHSKSVEYKILPVELHKEVRYMKYSEVIHKIDDAWNPAEFTFVE